MTDNIFITVVIIISVLIYTSIIAAVFYKIGYSIGHQDGLSAAHRALRRRRFGPDTPVHLPLDMDLVRARPTRPEYLNTRKAVR